MSRRARWTPRVLPEARRDMVTTLSAEAERLRGLVDRAARIQHDPSDLQAGVERSDALARSLRGADLYWVTGPMTRIAFDAARDVPTFDATAAPSIRGIMAFADALPAWDTAPIGGLQLRRSPAQPDWQYDEPVPIDGIAWDGSSGDQVQVRLLTRPERLPYPLLDPQSKHLVAVVNFGGPRRADLEALNAVGERSSDPAASGVLAMLMACWTLMMMPTVAERTRLDSRTGRPSTPQTPSGLGVDIIDLRPLRQVNVERDEVTGRRLTVRHLVRGHWTNQAYGPDRALRRLIWIAPYIKGPAGAPLKTSEDRVMVWRRG